MWDAMAGSEDNNNTRKMTMRGRTRRRWTNKDNINDNNDGNGDTKGGNRLNGTIVR